MAEAVTVTQDSFRSSVIDADQPVIVDFWASWCGPCKQMEPVLRDIAEEYDGRATVAKVNVEEERLLASMYQIMSIPALLVFNEGKKVAEFHGKQSKAQLTDALDSLV
ncbi:thioredoxin [Corynebacterium variabile]|uniref:thioredoxin n=1 Tax=Corynebacterium variabile TaxID=1727 RepID=UPI0002001B1F|nr:thioredoxin [Corynebacterium variabile]MDN6662093.1 thioredoxin [Corynebacterium variabile]